MGFKYLPEIGMTIVEVSTGNKWKVVNIEKEGYGLTWGYVIRKLRSKNVLTLSGFDIRRSYYPLNYKEKEGT